MGENANKTGGLFGRSIVYTGMSAHPLAWRSYKGRKNVVYEVPAFREAGLSYKENLAQSDRPLVVVGMFGVPLRTLPGVHQPGREHRKIERARELGIEVVPESYIFARFGLPTSVLAPRAKLDRVQTVAGIKDRGVVQEAAQAGLVHIHEEGHVPLASLVVLQQFASLVNRGVGPAQLRRRLDRLRTNLSIGDPLALLDRVEVVGNDLLLRMGDRLIQPDSGQYWLGNPRRVPVAVSDDPKPFASTEVSAATTAESDELFRQAIDAQDRGRAEEAAELYERVLRVDPERASARYNLGLLLSSMGHTDEAMAMFHEVLVRAPHHANAAYALARLLRARKRLREAEEQLTHAISYSPGMVDAYAMRADVRDRLGNHAGALGDWKTFVALAPQSRRVDHARERIATLSLCEELPPQGSLV